MSIQQPLPDQETPQIEQTFYKAVETLAAALKDKSGPPFDRNAYTAEIGIVSQFFQTDPDETLIIAPLVLQAVLKRKSMPLSKLQARTGHNLTDAVRLHRMLHGLSSRGLINRQSDHYRGDERYSLSRRAVNAVVNGRPFRPKEKQENPNFIFLEKVGDLWDGLQQDRIDYAEFMTELKAMMQESADAELFRYLSKIQLDEDELMLLFVSAYFILITGHSDINGEWILTRAGIGSAGRIGLLNALHSQQSSLMRSGLMEFDGMELFSSSTIKLTDDMLCRFAGVDHARKKINPKQGTLLEPESFSDEALYYNHKEQGELDEIAAILSDSGYALVQERLDAARMKKGIVVLLQGGPGTGKTSFVYALARRSGRKVFRIDFEEVHSKWMGQSEKNVAAIFREYSDMLLHEERHPILFLNECDGLLKKRLADPDTAGGMVKNTIVAILLEKFEQFEGILFLTTNLEQQQFDPGFERRFLYKVRLGMPDADTRRRIWQGHFPELTEELAAELSAEYVLSGGQISNVRKKFVISGLTRPELVLEDCVRELCARELVMQPERNRIGFR